VFHLEAFAHISAENNYCAFFFLFIYKKGDYKKGELSSISFELTRGQAFSLGILYEQAVGEYLLLTAKT